jgi:hypothetical protein
MELPSHLHESECQETLLSYNTSLGKGHALDRATYLYF